MQVRRAQVAQLRAADHIVKIGVVQANAELAQDRMHELAQIDYLQRRDMEKGGGVRLGHDPQMKGEKAA